MNLARILTRKPARTDWPEISLDDYQSLYYQGLQYFPFMQTMQGEKQEEISHNFAGYVEGAYKSNGVVFACMVARMLLFAEARFQFRRMLNGRPAELFGTRWSTHDEGWAHAVGRAQLDEEREHSARALEIIEHPWGPQSTTGDLLSRAICDVDMEGDFFASLRGGKITRLRPDWVTIVSGSRSGVLGASDTELTGYIYHPNGVSGGDVETFLPEEVVHWAPLPDPVARFRGMSWITPIIREIMGDNAAMTHKLRFFENGATVNLAVTLDNVDLDNFESWVDKFEDQHKGALNAYKTLYLAGGAKVDAIGANMRELEFSDTQGHGEVRVCNAARMPAIIVGVTKGLDAANYGMYPQARRVLADGTLRPLWRSFAAAMNPAITTPAGASLWYDDRDIPFLREDLKDASEIQANEASVMSTLITAGYEPDSVTAAVDAGGVWQLLKHTGKVSVQLYDPDAPPPEPKSPPQLPPGDDEPEDEDVGSPTD